MASTLSRKDRGGDSSNFGMVANHAVFNVTAFQKWLKDPVQIFTTLRKEEPLERTNVAFKTTSSFSRIGATHCNRSRWYESDQESRGETRLAFP
jgi:hypothetical protein